MAIEMLAPACLSISVPCGVDLEVWSLDHRSPFQRSVRLSMPSFLSVLPEGEWWVSDRGALAINDHGRGEHLEGACCGMIQILQHARAEKMLVGEHVGQRVDGAARDTSGPDLLRPLIRRPLAELFLKLLDQGLPVGHAVGVGRVALVLGQLGKTYRLAQ